MRAQKLGWKLLASATVVLLTPGLALAQEPTWLKLTSFGSGRSGHAMAYDVQRQQVVLFGGYDGTKYSDETWVWDGENWVQKFPVRRPPARARHAMAYDAVRGQVVLFGGWDGRGYLNDTWVWDGENWQRRWPANSPPARSGHAMAYDAARGQVVLFGGADRDDTWVWDGANWAQKTPANKPPARTAHAMAFDAARGQVLLFGGHAGGGQINDTWIWDGTNWIEKLPLSIPPARYGHAMAGDARRNEVVMFGGWGDTGFRYDTWAWNGEDWAPRPLAARPTARYYHAMTYDEARGQVVLAAGECASSARYASDTWIWDGTNWVEKRPLAVAGKRLGHAVAYDAARGQILLFGGLQEGSYSVMNDTWVWDGARWIRKFPVVTPPGRSGHAMAYDPARREVVLFGGAGMDLNTPLGDTWVWDGENWFKRTPPNSPPARSLHQMVYDSSRREIVLFGGVGPQGALSDTWIWTGTDWIRRTPAASPPARAMHGMADDAARDEVVLFGGTLNLWGKANDTWAWDGTTWKQKLPLFSPSARYGHVMAYDATRSQVLLVGGESGQRDTWAWDGFNWIEKWPTDSPPSAFRQPMVFDAARGRLILTASDTWTYEPAVRSVRPRLIAPGSGAGTDTPITAQFEHPQGWQQLQVVNLLLNFWLDGRQACYVAYVPATQALYLVDDWGNAGGPFAGGLILGQDTGTIGNSQCTIDGSQSWAEHDGKQVRLHLKVSFSSSFAGTWIWYLAARDATNNSGWQRLGVWKVPGAISLPGYPEVVELYPAEWTGRDPETLEVTVRDPQGAGDVGVVNVLVNDWLDGRQACYVAYVPAANAVFLVDDAGNAGGPFAGGVVLGSSQTAANSQCTIYGEGSSASATGERLTLRLRVQFKSGFAGNRVVYAAVRDLANNNSGWQAVGRRTVP